ADVPSTGAERSDHGEYHEPDTEAAPRLDDRAGRLRPGARVRAGVHGCANVDGDAVADLYADAAPANVHADRDLLPSDTRAQQYADAGARRNAVLLRSRGSDRGAGPRLAGHRQRHRPTPDIIPRADGIDSA